MSSPISHHDLDKTFEIIDTKTPLPEVPIKTPNSSFKSKSSEPLENSAEKDLLFGEPVSIDNVKEEPKEETKTPHSDLTEEPREEPKAPHSDLTEEPREELKAPHSELKEEPKAPHSDLTEEPREELKAPHSELKEEPKDGSQDKIEQAITPRESTLGSAETIDINKLMEDVDDEMSSVRSRSGSVVSDGEDIYAKVLRDVENMREDANSHFEFIDPDEVYLGEDGMETEVEIPVRARILDTPRSSKWRPSPVPLKKIVHEMENSQLETVTYRVDFDLNRIVDASVIGKGQDMNLCPCYSLETALNKPVVSQSVRSFKTPLIAYIEMQMFEMDRCYIEELVETLRSGSDRLKPLKNRLREIQETTLKRMESVYIEDPESVYTHYERYRKRAQELIQKLHTKYVLSDCKCDIYRMQKLYRDYIDTFNVETRKISEATKSV